MVTIARVSRLITPSGSDSASTSACETGVARTSARVWCGEHSAPALVSVVERHDRVNLFRYVQWCSLLGIDIDCSEHCLACLDVSAARPAAAGPHGELESKIR